MPPHLKTQKLIRGILLLLICNTLQAQQRDRLAELPVVCRNEWVTHTSVAPDGSLWMVTECGEIYRADDIRSPWHTLEVGELGSCGRTYENVVAFDRNTAVVVGNIWGYGFKRTSTGGRLWDNVKYHSKKQLGEWFHPVWRGAEGRMWTASQDGYLAFSSDSGRTFTTLRDTAFDHKTGIDNIYMLTADSGYIVCSDKSLYSSSDNWRTFHRWATPSDKGVSHVRPWKNFLIVYQDGKSYFATADKEPQWERTPLTLKDFEVDAANGMLWAIDDSRQVVLMEDINRWKPMGVNAQSIIGVHNGRLYCRVSGGVMRIDVDGVVENCPLLTDEHPIEVPEHTLTNGKFRWGHDGKSVYLQDRRGWYRVARPLDIAGMTPDPARKDRVIVMTEVSEWRMKETGKTFSVDADGNVAPYTYRQPLADFVKPGLQSLEIMTCRNVGWHVVRHVIGYSRSGNRLEETWRRVVKENYDLHFGYGHQKDTLPMDCGIDTARRYLPVAIVEQGLLALGERYSQFPTSQDFGLEDTSLDMHQVFYERKSVSSNKYGYTVLLVNQAGDTLEASGYTSAAFDLGFSTHFPWMLPMTVRWREAEFFTYQPALWQALREALPDSMMHKNYLDNSTLHVKDTLQSGDLLFLENNWSDKEKAISASTGSYTHVALVERDNAGKVWVIEAATGEGVRKRPFGAFANSNDVRYFGYHVYRLTVPFDTAAVISRAEALIGKLYDEAFLPDNDAYYCSELIQVAFGNLFEAKPMNWRDKEGNLPAYWLEHFKKLGMSIPEGLLGTNPTDLARSPLLRRL